MIRQEIWEEMKKAKTYQFSCLSIIDQALGQRCRSIK